LSSLHFYIEFTPEDRIRFEPKFFNGTIRGLRIKYQVARKTEKVNYSMTGFEPFFEYEWLTVAKYENLKGEALKDLMRPTLVTFSPHGLHMKESWGVLDDNAFINRVLLDLKGWVENRSKYDSALGNVSDEYREIGASNMVRVVKFVNFLFDFTSAESIDSFNKIYKGQSLIPIPMPEEDEWILEQNSISAHRIEKMAHRGDPDILSYGPFRVLTYQRSGEEA
jgi:hypothetical protein